MNKINILLILGILSLHISAIECLEVDSAPIQRTHYSTSGTVYPHYVSKLSSTVSGRIQEIFVDIGAHVSKGQKLLTIDSTLFQADVALAKAKLQAAKLELHDAEINYQRMKKLWEKPKAPSISQKRLEEAELRYEENQAEVKLAEEQLKKTEKLLDETSIKAPFDGVISQRYVHPGVSVDGSSKTPLFEIQDVHTIYIEFAVPQTYLQILQKGGRVLLEHDQSLHSVDLISPTIDETTRSAKCRIMCDNHAHTYTSGALLRIEIPLLEERHE